MVPIKPGDDVDGEPIQYSNPKLDPLWEAIAASGIPLCFHIGEAIPTAAPGAAGTFVLTQMQGFRHIWGQLTFGGVFDRFPKLRVVFVEGGICWVASMLHDADMIYNSFPTVMNPKLAHPPSWYWFNHCYATFMTDPAGLELLHRIGAGPGDVVVRLSAPGKHVRLYPQRHPGGVRRHQRRERPEDPRQDRARRLRHALKPDQRSLP